MTQPIRAVIFDLGGVLIDWDPRYLYRRLFPGDEAAMERFLADVVTQEWNAEQDSGRSWRDAVEQLTAVHPQHAALIAAYSERWTEMLRGSIEGTVEVLRALRESGVPLYALTNWSSEKFPTALERFDFLGWFEGIVVSGHERIRKPNATIFYRLLDRYGLIPESTLFIDDMEANVKAARAIGLSAIRYEGPERLWDELRTLGLLKARSRAS